MDADQTSDFTNAVVQTADGVVVRVHVQPKTRREQIIGMHGDRIKLAVTEPPDKGKANDAVVRLIAAALNLSPSRIELLRGATTLFFLTEILNAVAYLSEASCDKSTHIFHCSSRWETRQRSLRAS